MFTHQDCLSQWLEHSNKDKCELCRHVFLFQPLYAENMPEQLPLSLVIWTLAKKLVLDWSPLFLRIILSIFLWLGFVPLTTSWLYRIWIHRARVLLPELFVARLKWNSVWSDCISGLMIVAAIMLSFLSLMSFADFLRFHWDFNEGDPDEFEHEVAIEPQPVILPEQVNLENANIRVPEQLAGESEPVASQNVGQETGTEGGYELLQNADEKDNEAMKGPTEALFSAQPATGPVNSDGAPVHSGFDWHTRMERSYCGRRVGQQGYKFACGSCDGRCGPNSGCQCRACFAFDASATIVPRKTRVRKPIFEGFGYERKFATVVEGTVTALYGSTYEVTYDDPDYDIEYLSEKEIRDCFIESEAEEKEEEPILGVPAAHQLPVLRPQHHPLLQNHAAPNPQPIAQAEQPRAQLRRQPFAQEPDLPLEEVNVAVDELLGIRGPITTLFRNVLWLLAFIGAYLGLFAFIPFSIGNSIYTVTARYLGNFGMPIEGIEIGIGGAYSFPLDASRLTNFHQLLKQLQIAASPPEQHALQLADLAIISLGYVVMSTMVFTWRMILCALCQRMPLQMLERVAWGIECVAAVVKVGVLLTLKMLITPLLIGCFLDIATLQLFQATVSERITFLRENLVGSLLLHWVIGITFMLIVTVSILQLREVLHPALLAANIRPQEPHPDLLGSLLRETAKTHTRRMFLTLVIYASLLAVFVCVPVSMISQFWLHRLPLKPAFFYFVPQLQIPLELVLFHLAMLASLEKFKNKIGNWQYTWLKFVCRRLGLTQFLLPLPVIRTEGNGESEDQLVGEPLERPPPGWDDPIVGASQRWAWGEEPVSDLERNLAPRKCPSYVVLRILALLVLAWATILAMILLGLVGPFAIGRSFIFLCRIPVRFTHDPLTFALGIWLSWCFYSTCQAVVAFPLTQSMQNIKPLSLLRLCHFKALWRMFLAAALWLVCLPLLTGIFFDLMFFTSPQGWSSFFVQGTMRLMQCWGFGFVVEHIWIFHTIKQALSPDAHDSTEAVSQPLGASRAKISHLVSRFIFALESGDWEPLDDGMLPLVFVYQVCGMVGEALVYPSFIVGLIFLLDTYFDISSWLPSVLEKISPLSLSFSALQLLTFRTVGIWFLSLNLSLHCEKTTESMLSGIKAVVRDANFLIGLELKNHPETWKKASQSVS